MKMAMSGQRYRSNNKHGKEHIIKEIYARTWLKAT